MTPKDFMQAVWPSSGPYCIGYQMRSTKDATKTFFKNVVVDSIDEALEKAGNLAAQHDMYFAVLGLHQRQMIDMKQKDPRTGEPGKTVVRVHANMRATKAHIFDVDVGEDKPYLTQPEAVQALKDWVAETQLPIPTIISSGGGLHVYWLMDDEVPADEWVRYGEHMQALADHHGFAVDRSRTYEKSSVLRIPGTFNLKDRDNPRAVKIILAGAVTPVTDLQRMLRDAVARAGVTVAAPKAAKATSDWGESNLTVEYQGPTPTLKEVGDACGQVRQMILSQTKADHPHYGPLDNNAWYKGLMGVVRHVEDGENLCRKLTSIFPRTNSDIDFKLKQLEGFAPSKCETMREVMPWGSSACEGCPFLKDPSVPNPIAAARKTAQAPAPVVLQLVQGQPAAQTTIPNPPAPYARLKNGGITRKGKNADGDDVVETIYPYDLYPIRRVMNPETGVEQQLWCVELPIAGNKEFLVEAQALYDTRKFTETIANQGIYPSKSNVPYLQDYMVAYISELQKLTATDVQSSHLGWTDEYNQFVLPDRVLHADGSVKPALLTPGAQSRAVYIRQTGTLERQVELMKFYSHDDYVAHQALILGGLGSTLMHMTNQHGLIVNASGPAGASKSTALYSAGGLWGEPEQYAINGTNDGATTKARNERVTVMANLPVCVDEITHMLVKDAQNLAMFVTQPTGRLRLRTDGSEKSSGSEYKSTVMLCTANSSLHNLLSADNSAGTAGSMRVFEIEFRLAGVHEKAEADEFLRELKKNYGHIGPVFASYVTQNRAKVEKRLHEIMREMDRLISIDSAERFWSAYCAVILTANEVAGHLGLLSFNQDNLKRWLIDVQIPHMRGVVKEEYSEPLSLLSDYLESISGNILFVEQSVFSGQAEPYVRNRPHGALLAHYDIVAGQMYVLKDGFKRYCQRIGASSHKVLTDLSTPRRDLQGNLTRVVTARTVRKTLGAGTEYAKTQSYCFTIDMTHPDVVDGPHPLLKSMPAGKKPDLKLVT